MESDLVRRVEITANVPAVTEYEQKRAQMQQLASMADRQMAMAQQDTEVGILHRRLKRAEAVIGILRVFYADQVKQAESIADSALREY